MAIPKLPDDRLDLCVFAQIDDVASVDANFGAMGWDPDDLCIKEGAKNQERKSKERDREWEDQTDGWFESCGRKVLWNNGLLPFSMWS